jgi:hypothetical protein
MTTKLSDVAPDEAQLVALAEHCVRGFVHSRESAPRATDAGCFFFSTSRCGSRSIAARKAAKSETPLSF